jgi:DNA-binding MarR family transcriptional regulator
MKKVNWKTISQFEGPEHSPGFLLWQVSMEWRRQIESALSTIGLTHPQFVLLASLDWLTQGNRQVSQVELARHCKTDINMTSQVLRTLERKGCIERHHNHGNERSKYSRITAIGAQLIEQAIPIVEMIDRKFFSKLPEQKLCLDILKQLITRREK